MWKTFIHPTGEPFLPHMVIHCELLDTYLTRAESVPSTICRVLIDYSERSGPECVTEFANVCTSRSRATRYLRSRANLLQVAKGLINKALELDSNYPPALCAQGRHLLAASSNSSQQDLTSAFNIFSQAATLGSAEGAYLKGRIIILNPAIFGNGPQFALGKQCIMKAVKAVPPVPGAAHLLATCYVYPPIITPEIFTDDLPSGRIAKEKFILDIYLCAADLGHGDALNDIGVSYEMEYGGLPCDFVKAAECYKDAIQMGCWEAYANLGRILQTGMDSKFPENIDIDEAVRMFQAGAKKGNANCLFNLGKLYEVGTGELILKNFDQAEACYVDALALADRKEDAILKADIIENLCSLRAIKIKLTNPEAPNLAASLARLQECETTHGVSSSTMTKTNNALKMAVNGNVDSLNAFLSEPLASCLLEFVQGVVKEVMEEVDSTGGLSESTKKLIEHIFGTDDDPLDVLGVHEDM